MTLNVKPIAYIRTDFKHKFGLPRQSGRAPGLIGKIVFEPEFRNPDALRGIEGFSHLWLIFDFSQAHREEWSPTVRPPRLGGNRRVGVFATRSPFRPNPIGLSSVKMIELKHTAEEGTVIIVSGADLLDMTPILDIKPYLPSVDIHTDALGGFSDEFIDYKLNVSFPEALLETIPAEKRKAVIECLKDDPRPAYQEDPNRLYNMEFSGFDIRFKVCDNICTVEACDKIY